MRKFLLPCLLFNLLLLNSFPLTAQVVIRGPYLQKQTDESIILRWRTDTPTDSRVDWGLSPQALTMTQTDTTLTTEHSVELSGLSASTRYYYGVGTVANLLAGQDSSHYFETAPIPGTVLPVRIWATGDFGKASQAQLDVKAQYLDLEASGKGADVWLWLGDNAYDDGTDAEYQAKVFDSTYGYPEIFRHTVFWGSPGNHDYNSVNRFDSPPTHTGPYYDIIDAPQNGEAGGLASGYELYYSFDYGNVHFLSINSELQAWTLSSGTPMANWIADDLAANTQPWVVAYWHQPPYSKGSHDSDAFFELLMQAMRENILPVLEQGGVDLVLCGHSHVYERSYLIEGHYDNSGTFDPQQHLVDGSSGDDNIGEAYVKYTTGPLADRGAVYAVVGNSGSVTSAPALNHPAMYAGWGCDTCAGSIIVDVLDNRLDGTYYSATGAVIDEFTILKMEGTGTEDALPGIRSVEVSPNPFSESIRVDAISDFPARLSLRILNVTGQELFREDGWEVNGNSTRVLQPEIPAGLYFLEIQSGERKLIRKVIKR